MKKIILCLFALLSLAACGDGIFSANEIAQIKALPVKKYSELNTTQKATAKKLMIKTIEGLTTDDFATNFCKEYQEDTDCLTGVKTLIEKFKEKLKYSAQFDAWFKDAIPLYIVVVATIFHKDFVIGDRSDFEKKNTKIMSDFGVSNEDMCKEYSKILLGIIINNDKPDWPEKDK